MIGQSRSRLPDLRRGRFAALLFGLLAGLLVGLFWAPPPVLAEGGDDAGGPSHVLAAWPLQDAVVRQTPPDFRWPFVDGMAAWQLRLTHPDGTEEERESLRNGLLWDRVLPPGNYRWALRPVTERGGPGAWGPTRRFTIAEEAEVFLVPDLAALWRRLAEKPRPRALPSDAARARLLQALSQPERAAALARLRARVEMAAAQPITAEPRSSPPDIADAALRRKVERRIGLAVYQETNGILEAALLWRALGRDAHLAAARRRLLALAAWDPDGATGFDAGDMASGRIARTLAWGFDLLHERLDAAERDQVLAAIAARAVPIHRALRRLDFLWPRPTDSHGFILLGDLAAIAVLTAGELPAAATWYRDSLTPYLLFTSPWGGEDGGFGNGSAYGLWNLREQFMHWDVLREAAGIDLAGKAWSRNLGAVLAAMLPPGQPVGTFGDGAELDLRFEIAHAALAYGRRVPGPVSAWYAAAWPPGDAASEWDVVFAPAGPRPEPRQPQNALHAASTGWVAMHSDIADSDRFSIYFKSSPYGSYNHSHADQNGFTILGRGRPLAIDSGYYDAYGSAHWAGWSTATRAHNAITYDGGRGQRQDSLAATGRITGFAAAADLTVASGDATAAYGGELSRAVRTLAWLRPDLVLVYDGLASRTPRRWEWNLHSASEMVTFAPGHIGFANGPAALCVQQLAGAPTVFSKTDAVPAPPLSDNGEWPRQWHGRFATRDVSKAAELLFLLRLDCAEATAAQVTALAGGGFALDLAGRRLRIDAAGAGDCGEGCR